MVGVGKHSLADAESGIPAVRAFVQQNAHHFGDGQGGMGIVELDGHLVGQVVQRAVLVQVVAHDVRDGSGRQEILLAQTQDLTLGVVVVGIQDLGDQLSGSAVADGGVVVAGVEAAHVEAGRLGLPQTQLGHTGRAVTGHIHIVGHSDDAVVVLVLHMMETAVPGLDGLAVKADLLGLVGVALDPHLTAGQPVIGSFLLPAVHDLLLEDTVFIQDGVTGAGDAVGGHAVQIAGGQAAQTAVAQARVGLLVVDVVDFDAGLVQHSLGHFVQAQVEQAGAQAAAHQEFHAQVVNLLLTFAQGAGLELFLLVGHDLTHDGSHAAVDLIHRGNVQRDIAFAHQRVFEQFIKFFFRIFHQNDSLLLQNLAFSTVLYGSRKTGPRTTFGVWISGLTLVQQTT